VLANNVDFALCVYNETRKAAPLHALELRRASITGDALWSLLHDLGV
jgi:hypothetical protein